MNQFENYKGPQKEKIRSMFSEISSKYDRANHILSGGVHILWRKKLVRLTGAQTGDHVLDCATGTGDLAFEFKKVVGENGKVIGSDFCPEMMDPAREKAKAADLDVAFQTEDVTQLSFNDAQFDIASISFGIRNVENPLLGIQELLRVVKPGGTVAILEFGQPQNSLFNKVYGFYSQNILPTLGGWVTGKKDAYQYLQDSSSEFPCAGNFVKMISMAGQSSGQELSDIQYYPLTGGIAYIYIATKKLDQKKLDPKKSSQELNS